MDVCSISSVLHKEEAIDGRCKISKLRNYASQIYAASATNIVKFTTGSFLGFTSVVVAELYKEDAEIHMSSNDLSWFSSKCFMPSVGCIFLSVLAQCIGARLTMLLSMVFCGASYLIFYFANTAGMLLGAQAMVGLFYMTSIIPGVTYVVEITQPQLRSALTASTTFSTMFAAFLVILLSNFLHWRTIALVMLVFPIVGFIAVCTIPESPHWLANKNCFDRAEASLCWLRGWSTPDHVTLEFNALKETYRNSSQNSDCSETEKKLNSSRWSLVIAKISSYHHRSFYVPLSLMCLLFILHSLTGLSPVVTYCIVIFKQINAPIDAHVSASIFDAMRLVGALVCIFSMQYTGKKKLVYITLTAAGLAHLTSSSALLLNEYQIYPQMCRWVATIAMMFTSFFTSAGIDKVIFVLNAEIFPTKYRNVGTGIGLFVAAIASAISVKLFLPLLDAVLLPGVFAMYGTASIITCAAFHFMFPETEGKTLQEIEEHFEHFKKFDKKVEIDKPPIEAKTLHQSYKQHL